MSEALLCDLDALADMIADKLLQKMEAPISRSQELYTISQLAERYTLSPDSIRRRIKEGRFGEPVLMGKRGLRITAAGVRMYEGCKTNVTQRNVHTRRRVSRTKREDPGPI